MNSDNHLFDEFPPVSRDQWERVIRDDLNGADYKTKLKWDTGEGVDALPFYRGDDLALINRTGPITKKNTVPEANSWEIREPIFENSVLAANESSKNALQGGADALEFQLQISPGDGTIGSTLKGLPIQQQTDFSQLLVGINIGQTPLHFNAGMASPALMAMLWNETQNKNFNTDQIHATFLYDPFPFILQNGYRPKDEDELKSDICRVADFSINKLPGLRPLGINARFYHNCGATIVQELAYALAAASDYMNILTDQGFEIDDIAKRLHFSFSVGSNYFLEIAKFRATRVLWRNLLDAYGGSEIHEAYLHGQTSEWNKTLYDPYTNMLRTSTETMSAAIGGCDSITVLPFDHSFRQPGDFSQRIARNQQLLFSEEAYLNKVGDPGAGSYYVETLTDKLGEKAWSLFKEIEAEGGLFTAINNGTVQTAIEESRQQRNQNIAMRKRIFIGTNQYAATGGKETNKSAKKESKRALKESGNKFEINTGSFVQSLAGAFREGATMGDITPTLLTRGEPQLNAITPYRGPEAFEKLRSQTEHHQPTPKVLTLPMGNKKMRKARSTFTVNFFGTAGYDIVDPIGFNTIDDAVNKVKEQRPDIAVLCSSDAEYKELVPAVCRRLSSLNNQPIIVLAGYPKEHAEQYSKAGIDVFIHSKSNVLETLKEFQHKIGVS